MRQRRQDKLQEQLQLSLLREQQPSQSRDRITSIQSGLTEQQPELQPEVELHVEPEAMKKLKGKARVQQQVVQLLFEQNKHKNRVRKLLLEKRQAEREAAFLRYQQQQLSKQPKDSTANRFGLKSRNRIIQLQDNNEQRSGFFKYKE